MSYVLNLFPNFPQAFGALWWVFLHGGWVAFVITLVYILYQLYDMEIRAQFRADQEWTFLLIRTPRENLTSTLAVEQIFSQLHALHTTITWAHRRIEGRVQLWFSFEIVSLGGKVSMIIRCPKKMRDTVEAAFYAQYPTAEITEVRDYFENVEYHPGHSEFDIWGCEMRILEDEVIPIKTYVAFEHPTAENKIIDPLATLFESLGKMEPHEFFGVQIIAQPLADPEWKDRAEMKAKELMGEEVEEKKGWLGHIQAGLSLYNPFKLIEGIFSKEEEKEKERPKDELSNNWMRLNDIDKERVNSIKRKAGKPGYLTKIRLLYMAPHDKFDGSKKTIIIGALRNLGDAQSNGFKPDTKETWTGKEYHISPGLEQPYINYIVNRRKHHLFNGWKERSYLIGREQFILNIEELATIFHLPLAAPGAAVGPAVERVESKKSQAPVNLPIG
jgi:hypothetical protein